MEKTKRPRIKSRLVKLEHYTRFVPVAKEEQYRAPMQMIHEAISEPKAWNNYNACSKVIKGITGQ